MTKMAEVTARLRVPDGREFDVRAECEDPYADGQAYWWTEGNGSCDCNRSLFLNRQHALNLGDDDGGDVPCLPCGDTITLLSLKVNGIEQLSSPDR